jgi:hypothetical protein
MRIDSVGNVGIGTTTPHAALDVKGQIISGTYPPVNQAILGICLDNNTNVNAGFTYGVQIEDSLANSIPLKIHFNPPGGSPNMAMEVMTKGWGYCANFIGGEGVVISNDSTHPFPGYYPNVPALQVNNQKGWSDAVSILSKSNVNNFQLQLVQLDSDYTRMDMANAFGKAWTIAALRTPAAATDRLNFYNEQSGADRFIIYGNGDATLAGTLTQSSDARLKKNIRPLHAVLPSLFSLSGYSYNWLDETKGKEMQIGLLAQEVERVYPQLVKTDEQGNKSVAYQNMVPVLLEALKELKTELDSIKQEIKTLKAINNPKK